MILSYLTIFKTLKNDYFCHPYKTPLKCRFHLFKYKTNFLFDIISRVS